MARGGKRHGAGRKVGAVTKKSSAVAGQLAQSGIMPLEILVTSMRTAWASGDVALACKLANDTAPYMHPRIAPKDMPVNLKNFTGDLANQGQSVLAAMAKGEVSPGQASDVLTALASQARITEITDLERRVAALEGNHGKS
jgi:hypothetical protein